MPGVRVVVVVPSSGGRADELVAVLDSWPDAHVDLVWNGDPHLRPPGRWADDAWASIDGFAGGVVRAALAPALRGLVVALDVVARGDEPALVLDAGSAIIGRPVDLPTGAVGVVAKGAPPVDGLTPTIADLTASGPYSTSVLSAPPELAGDLVRRLIDAGSEHPPGPALAAALVGRPVELLPGEVLGWPILTPSGAEPSDVALVDLVDVDPAEPWHLDFGPVPPRVRLSDRSDVHVPTAPSTGASTLRVPGGIEIDAVIGGLVADALRAARRGEGEPPPDPWRAPSSFAEWLETPAHPWEPDVGRYWYALWWSRADLQSAFADPAGDDLGAFRDWIARRHRYEGTSAHLRGLAAAAVSPWRSDGRRSGGIDVVGYFGSEMSLGNVADRLVASLVAADVPHRTVALRRSGSPGREHGAIDDVLSHDVAVVVANHDQVGPLLAERGDVLAGRRLIGYWHWDVELVPDEVAARMQHFEQIWVLNEYTARTLGSVPGAPPVRSLPLPVPEPRASAATRDDLGLPPDRPVVLVTFDHLSVTERKNPIGAIEAFRRAFPEPSDTGPVLVVKTMNAAQRWVEHERVRLAAAGRPDVIVLDRLLSKPDQMALVAHADVLLSLHRAEGLGLHLVEAMWLGTPTIATRYSGNLTFMDDGNSMLVDATMIPVDRGEGFFPPSATWADPDLDQAASHLRVLLGDPDLRRRLAAAGRARMERQPSFEQIGNTIAAWCGIR